MKSSFPEKKYFSDKDTLALVFFLQYISANFSTWYALIICKMISAKFAYNF